MEVFVQDPGQRQLRAPPLLCTFISGLAQAASPAWQLFEPKAPPDKGTPVRAAGPGHQQASLPAFLLSCSAELTSHKPSLGPLPQISG